MLRTVHMDFLYGGTFRTGIPEAYERLILDCLLGDATLFTRADEVEEQWSLVDAIVALWKRDRPSFPNYAAGTWGPAAANELDAPGRTGMATALGLGRRDRPRARRAPVRPGVGRAVPADERDDAPRLGAGSLGGGCRGRPRRTRRAASVAHDCALPASRTRTTASKARVEVDVLPVGGRQADLHGDDPDRALREPGVGAGEHRPAAAAPRHARLPALARSAAVRRAAVRRSSWTWSTG